MSLPFRKGSEYRVKRDYAFLNHKLSEGESVVFSESGYSAYDGLTRYWFKNTQSGETNAWHVFDSQEKEIRWEDFFEEISN